MTDPNTSVNFKSIIKQYQGSLFVIVTVSILGSIILAYGLTPIYRSQARILVDQGVMSAELIQTTVVGFDQERIYITRTRVMSDENLDVILERRNPYPEISAPAARRRELREDVYFELEEPEDGTITFRIEYENPDPRMAFDVARDLTNLYLAENLISRTEAASETWRFLDTEAEKLTREIGETEQRIARFKEEYAGTLPEQAGLNTQRLDRAENQIEGVQREIRTLQERRNQLEAELRNVDPSATIYTADGTPVLSAAERLRMLEAEFISLSAIYAENHPDLVRLRKEIETLNPDRSIAAQRTSLQYALATQTAEMEETLLRYSPDHPDVRRLERAIARTEQELANLPTVDTAPAVVPPQEADNPLYVQLSVQLEGVIRELAALRQTYDEARARADLYEERLALTPQVEQDLLTLTRGYAQQLDKFDEIRSMQTEAEWAVALETEQKGDRFSLLESPGLSSDPAKPNRPALIFLGLLLGLGGGLGYVASAENLDKTVRNKRDLVELMDMPPIAAIPLMANKADARRTMLRMSVAAASLVIGILYTTSVVIENYGTN